MSQIEPKTSPFPHPTSKNTSNRAENTTRPLPNIQKKLLGDFFPFLTPPILVSHYPTMYILGMSCISVGEKDIPNAKTYQKRFRTVF